MITALRIGISTSIHSDGRNRVEIVSTSFKGKTPVQCHRLVYGILDEELKSGVHALSLKTKTSSN
jgi:stress-induced morphogen